MRIYSKAEMEKLYKQYEKSFASIIRKMFAKYDTLYDDMMQECYFALINACRGFDESRKLKFHTYLYITVCRHLHYFIKNNGSIVKVPYYSKEMQRAAYDVDILLDNPTDVLRCSQVNSIMEYIQSKYTSQECELFAGFYLYRYSLSALGKRYGLPYLHVSKKVFKMRDDVYEQFKEKI